jgi:hypothetical protein
LQVGILLSSVCSVSITTQLTSPHDAPYLYRSLVAQHPLLDLHLDLGELCSIDVIDVEREHLKTEMAATLL